MRRREFVTLLGGAAATWPVAVRAQQSGRMRRIGVLLGVAGNDPVGRIWLTAFKAELARAGWAEGRNIAIELRGIGGDTKGIPTHAAELVALKPDVILASGTLAVAAIQKETKTVPVIGVLIIDMVASGFAKSLARPGGNITGFSNFETAIGGKWLLTLKEVSPNIERVAIMLNPANGAHQGIAATIEQAARSSGVHAIRLPVGNTDEIMAGMTSLPRPNTSLVVLPDAVTVSNADQIIGLAAKYELPAIYPYKNYVKSGGLMSYGPDLTDFFRRAALYADRILRGESPADLPIQTPTRFELAFNLRAAKSLGLAVSETFLLRADEVIE